MSYKKNIVTVWWLVPAFAIGWVARKQAIMLYAAYAAKANANGAGITTNLFA